MKLTLNDAGKKLYDKWWENYCQENDRMGGNSAEGDFVEGWSIIDNRDYVKTLTDVCDLFIFGYDTGFRWTAVDSVDEFIEDYGVDDGAYGFTYAEIRAELLKYYMVEDDDNA